MSKNSELKFNLPSVDDLFEPVQGKDVLDIKKIIPIPIKDITDFPEHPFKVIDDDRMQDMVKSVKENGIMLPAIVRPKENGGYEMISGHRRKRACQLAKLEEIPCIIKDLTDEEATILMVDTNIQQREEILPSEKAYAYKMKIDALKHQGKRTDLTSSQVGTKLRTDEKVAQEFGESRNQIQRYVRLTALVPELLELVDNKTMALSPAVELSYLTEEEQYVVLDCIECNVSSPSHAQAIHLKKLSQEGKLTAEKIEDILGEEKANQIPKYKINQDRFIDVLPKNITTEKEVEDFLYDCVVEHNKRQKMKQLSR